MANELKSKRERESLLSDPQATLGGIEVCMPTKTMAKTESELKLFSATTRTSELWKSISSAITTIVDEVHFEATPEGLQFRLLNSNATRCAEGRQVFQRSEIQTKRIGCNRFRLSYPYANEIGYFDFALGRSEYISLAEKNQTLLGLESIPYSLSFASACLTNSVSTTCSASPFS